MKRMLFLTMLFIIGSCSNATHEPDATLANEDNVKLNMQDSAVNITIVRNISDASIKNATGRTIDILFNGVDDYLGGKRYPDIGFNIECMTCEPVQAYENGFLFGKRLYVTNDSVTVYKNDRNISDTAGIIKRTTFYGEKKSKVYSFSQGKALMKYNGMSCMDAGFVSVDLRYPQGIVSFEKLINASLFEYDLDSNGVMEQYLIGVRNCSQEIVLIRITSQAK